MHWSSTESLLGEGGGTNDCIGASIESEKTRAHLKDWFGAAFSLGQSSVAIGFETEDSKDAGRVLRHTPSEHLRGAVVTDERRDVALMLSQLADADHYAFKQVGKWICD